MRKNLLLIFALLLSFGLKAQDNLYLIGNACSAGWEANDALPMTKSGDVFTWTGQLTPGELKFLSALGSWDNAYGSDEYDKAIWSGGDYTFAALTDGDRKFQIKLRGTYTITISGGTINFAWTDRIYPVGGGCTAGWNPSSGQYLEAENCCSYKGKVNFTGEGEFKLLCQENWGDHYGPNEEGAALDAMSGYAVAMHTDGDFKYNVGLTGEYDVVLDVYAGKLYVGTILPSVTIRAQFDTNIKTAFDNSFNLYLWTAMGANNVPMTENEGWYEATMENVFAPYNFLFNKAADDWSIQTPDVTNNTAASLCMHVTNTGSIAATVSEGCENLEEEDEPLVRPEVKLLGLNTWVVADGYTMVEAADQMSCSYTATLDAGTHEFKIYTTNDNAYNGANFEIKRAFCTDVQLYSSGLEPNVKIQADIAGEYTFIYYYDTRKLSVIYPEIPESSNPMHYLKGIGGDWGGIVMIPAADEQTCSCTVTITAAMIQTGWQNFKVFYKDEEETEHWLGGEVTLTRNALNGTLVDVADARNAYLLADFAGNYTFTYTYETKAISVTYPELPQVDLKGINGNWEGVHMVDAADHLSCSYTYSLEAGDYEFKVFFMERDDQQWLGCGTVDPAVMERDNCTDFQFATGTANCQLKADKAGDYTFTYNYVSRKMSVTFPELQTMTLELNKDGFASIYMPYDFTLPMDVEAYKGVLSDGSVVLTKVEQEVLPRETGLILYSETIANATLTEGTETAAAIEDNAFTGTLVDVQQSDFYVLAEVQDVTAFYHVTGPMTIPANRAYLKVAGGSGAPLRIRFATEVTTEMTNVNNNANVNKIVREGRVYIVRDNKVYTVMGQLVKE